jgi:hypothetical protein
VMRACPSESSAIMLSTPRDPPLALALLRVHLKRPTRPLRRREA